MRDKPWNRDQVLPWPDIKAVWKTYWDTSKPILLEKSPPNLIRTRDILAHFHPVSFIVMVRNPYAHCEGLMRRNQWTAKRAANFSMKCLQAQLKNSRELENTLVFTYESLVRSPANACSQLTAFMPGLGSLKHEASFEVHSVDGTLSRPIIDLNAKKIAALSVDTMEALNTIFRQHEETIKAWGYDFISPESAPDCARSKN